MTAWDVVVVGAGPAGAVAAHEAARAGASVLLLDRSAFPRWKVCGACLSAGALEVLDEIGLGGLCERLGGVRLRKLALQVDGRVVKVPLEGSMALSRSALDDALVGAAVERGVEFWPESRASLGPVEADVRRIRVTRHGLSETVTACVVVDATGLGRGLASDAVIEDGVAPRSRIGLGATFDATAYPVEPGELHMAVGAAGYVGLVRVEDGTLNVAAAVDPGPVRAWSPERTVQRILDEAGMPVLPETATLGWRGTPLLTRARPDVGAHRVLRLGDAAGYVEPFTGEGMCWAVSGGRAVAPIALSGVRRWHAALLGDWESYHRHHVRPAQRLCRVMALALRRPWLVGAAVRALGVAPGLARPFVHRAARATTPLEAHRA